MGKKSKRGQSASFLMLDRWIYDTPAYQSLGLGARALYWELKRKFNGYNNGRVYLSQRDAAKALNRDRGTIAKYYAELEEKGFLIKTQGHCLGPEGKGQAALWALTEQPLDGVKATMNFKAWKNQKPVRETPHSLAVKSSHPCGKTQLSTPEKLEKPAIQSASTVLEKPAIYISNHIPRRNERLAALSVASGFGLCGKADQAAA